MALLFPALSLALIFVPIVVPLFMWYILKKRESKLYGVMRGCRIFVAVLILIAFARTLFTTDFDSSNAGSMAAGGVIGQAIIAYLLMKKWHKKNEKTDGNKVTPQIPS